LAVDQPNNLNHSGSADQPIAVDAHSSASSLIVAIADQSILLKQVCTSLQTDNYASTPPVSFLQAGCPSCRPTNSIKALKAHKSV